jgi:hypothetical protein
MSARYTLAFERIRALLESRSQAQPLLEAEEIRRQLGGWPSIRTVRRYVESIRNGDVQIGRHGQTSHINVDTVSSTVSTAGESGRRV